MDMLKRDSTWSFMTKFVRAVFPMLVVLRLADKKDPQMDKLYYYVRRMDKTIEKSKVMLDALEAKSLVSYWRAIKEIADDDIYTSSDCSDHDSDETDYSSDNITEANHTTTDKKTLGDQVIDIWNKRRNELVTDFAIAGWLLSPIPEIYDDSSANMDGSHRDAVDRLLKKMMASGLADDSDELAAIMNTFWDEFEQFKTKSGCYGKSYIWSNSQNSDILTGASHFWHKKYSYCYTKVLGKFACRVCSKIVGIGSAERTWGTVKHLKTDKRAHLSPEAVEKQATIFGASCMTDAKIDRDNSGPIKFWHDDDFDKQFDMLALAKPIPPPQRILKCYLEEWEKEHLFNKSDVSKAKFLRKYGGLEFDDLDNGVHFKISSKEMHFQRRSKNDAGGWCVNTTTTSDDSDEEDYQPWSIFKDCALHDCLAAYYKQHPEKNVRVVLLKEQIESIEELVGTVARAHANTEENDSDDSSISVHAHTGATRTSDLGLCGGCGKPVGPVHKCDICNKNMHPFCGRTIGEEGYGSKVRCPRCDGSIPI